ncbi:MAG: hypothetical protein DWB45_08955 [Xanthomonadales bacterium]|nr:MAG: hypothetical protein F9K31_01505 [Dokdonella sp.]MBC6942837.1 hypothetical protein [Xanthomonadales bacterium]MCC6594981.1 hypothetical protein [Rhodanobacteraceae bacterium]MDL1868438.1 hypothetical protein [Gammaproteobacteria bacterium PRO6]
MRRALVALSAALAATLLLSGCSFFQRQADRRANEYKSAHETRPLEVPPDLDTPNGSAALSVPSIGAGATSSGVGAGTSAPPANVATAPPLAGAGSGVSLAGDGLAVSDTVASTWTRVGLALERSGAATVLSRDESGASYVVETTGQTTVRPGWFKRAITFGRAGNKVTAKVQLNVRVTAAGNGSRVSIEGTDSDAARDAARALLQTLRERLS